MTIGERIAARRKELGLSQEELAKRLGNKSRASVCTVEKGKEDLTTSRLLAYARALDCTSEYLMGWEGDVTQGRMTYEEVTLVNSYRKADDGTKTAVCKLLDIERGAL